MNASDLRQCGELLSGDRRLAGTIFRKVSARRCTVTGCVLPSLWINSHRMTAKSKFAGVFQRPLMDTHRLVSALLILLELHSLEPCSRAPYRCQYLQPYLTTSWYTVCVRELDKNRVKHLNQKLQSCHHMHARCSGVNPYNRGPGNLVQGRF